MSLNRFDPLLRTLLFSTLSIFSSSRENHVQSLSNDWTPVNGIGPVRKNGRGTVFLFILRPKPLQWYRPLNWPPPTQPAACHRSLDIIVSVPYRLFTISLDGSRFAAAPTRNGNYFLFFFLFRLPTQGSFRTGMYTLGLCLLGFFRLDLLFLSGKISSLCPGC